MQSVFENYKLFKINLLVKGNVMNISSNVNKCSIPEGDRLNNFKVMIGNAFTPNTTGISEISTWNQCVHVPGELCTWIVVTFCSS